MPSKTRSLKTKPIQKTSKFVASQLKTQTSSLKHSHLSAIFKNLELETACELPTMEEEKPVLKDQGNFERVTSMEIINCEDPAIIKY